MSHETSMHIKYDNNVAVTFENQCTFKNNNFNISDEDKLKMFLLWSKVRETATINNILMEKWQTANFKKYQIDDILREIFRINRHKFNEAIEIMKKIINIPSDFKAIEIALNQSWNECDLLNRFTTYPEFFNGRPKIVCDNGKYKLVPFGYVHYGFYFKCDQCNIRYSDEKDIQEISYESMGTSSRSSGTLKMIRKCNNCTQQSLLIDELLEFTNVIQTVEDVKTNDKKKELDTILLYFVQDVLQLINTQQKEHYSRDKFLYELMSMFDTINFEARSSIEQNTTEASNKKQKTN
jgi:hypothetical protein